MSGACENKIGFVRRGVGGLPIGLKSNSRGWKWAMLGDRNRLYGRRDVWSAREYATTVVYRRSGGGIRKSDRQRSVALRPTVVPTYNNNVTFNMRARATVAGRGVRRLGRWAAVVIVSNVSYWARAMPPPLPLPPPPVHRRASGRLASVSCSCGVLSIIAPKCWSALRRRRKTRPM